MNDADDLQTYDDPIWPAQLRDGDHGRSLDAVIVKFNHGLSDNVQGCVAFHGRKDLSSERESHRQMQRPGIFRTQAITRIVAVVETDRPDRRAVA